MPIYEYQCEDCGRTTEALQRIGEAPLSECPHCGGSLRKLISAPAFQFKGSGWYVTDYAKKGAGGGKGSKGGDAEAAGSGETAASGKGSQDKADSGAGATAKGGDGGSKAGGSSGGEGS